MSPNRRRNGTQNPETIKTIQSPTLHGPKAPQASVSKRFVVGHKGVQLLRFSDRGVTIRRMNLQGDPKGENFAGRQLAPWVAFVVCAVVLVAFRLQAFDLPLETDEANYAYIGGRLLDGDRLYVDVWDHQPFGVFVLTAGLIEAFGDGPLVFRWAATGASLISLGCIMLILRRICCNRAALVGGLLFAVVSIDPGTGGEGCNREVFMNAMILGAWACATCLGRPARSLLLAGALLGVASTFKTIVAVHWVLLALYWVVRAPEGDEKEQTAGRKFKFVACLALGPAIIWLAATAYFAADGRLHEFLDAVFFFNLGYAESGEPFFMRFVRFFAPVRHRFIFESALPLWIASAVATFGVGVTAFRQRWNSPRLVMMMVLSGFLATCLPGRFWPHYYYLLIPACVIVTVYAMEAVAISLSAPLGTTRGWKIPLSWSIVLFVPLLAGAWETRHFLLASDFGKTVKRYNSRDFWGRAHGRNVASVTDPGDTVFVFGNDAAIYFYADRRCASRYTMITGLSDGMSGAEERRKILLQELEKNPPRLILVLFDEEPWEEWKEFLHRHYTEPIGWDKHDTTREPILFVVARKDAPVGEINWDWDRSSVGGWDPNSKYLLPVGSSGR